MSKLAEDRFASASEAVTALAAALKVKAPASSSTPQPAGPGSRSHLIAAAAQAVQTQLTTDPAARSGEDDPHATTYSLGSKRAVRRRKRHVQSGQSVGLLPFSS